MATQSKESIFPTFFLSGFECSTFHWGEQGRRDLNCETGHDKRAKEDYGILSKLGIAVAREGIPWPLVDKGDGEYDFRMIDIYLEAQHDCQILPIWDLCHYGYPERLDPFDDSFVEAFANYSKAAAEYVLPRSREPRCFTPINEITFFSFIGGEWGWVAPFRKSKEDRFRLREQLCKAAIAGVKAIREVDPKARMVHVDPLVLVVPPKDRPDLADEAREEMYEDTFLAWDIIGGLKKPEFGGSKEILDIVGVNCYSFGQMEFRESGPHHALGPKDPRIEPLCDLLRLAWDRYQLPLIIGETSGLGDGRPVWLKDVMEESLAAVREGIDLHGICLFPAVDMPDWHNGRWLHNGICDVTGPQMARKPFKPYVDELRRWQKMLNRVTELDEDPFSDPVNLQDVIDAAHARPWESDKNWT